MKQDLTSGAQRHRVSWTIAAFLPMLALSLIGGAMTTAHSQTPKAVEFTPRDEDPKDFPVGTGRDDAFYACTACHGFRLIAQQGLSRDRWNETFNYMTERHNACDHRQGPGGDARLPCSNVRSQTRQERAGLEKSLRAAIGRFSLPTPELSSDCG